MTTHKLKLVTHDGSFHTDDVFACAALSIYLDKRGEDFEVIRTRDQEIINTGDYVFDVGGVYDSESNKFDHHQTDFQEKHGNGIIYSSFGLVWKKFGPELCGDEKAAKVIEEKLVSPIDAGDNGFDLVENKYETTPYLMNNIIQAMRPTWKENQKDMDANFLKCVGMAKEILLREIIQAQDGVEASQAVISIYNNSKDKRILILDKNYPYEYTLHNFPEPLFVIYPRASDGFWSAKAVREDPKAFKNRKDFPSAWAGLRDQELQKVSGVEDVIFCHRGLFTAVAKSKEGAIKLAQIALES